MSRRFEVLEIQSRDPHKLGCLSILPEIVRKLIVRLTKTVTVRAPFDNVEAMTAIDQALKLNELADKYSNPGNVNGIITTYAIRNNTKDN